MNLPLSARSPAMIQARPSPRAVLEQLGYTSDWTWSWSAYKPSVKALARSYGLVRHLEIGGGRDTLFTPEEAEAEGFEVTVNDISPRELSLAPEGFGRLLCDISAPELPPQAKPGSFDFLYSRMVMEHVADVPRMWTNAHRLLREGGVALAFYPTLYAPPFLINKLMPERLSRAVLRSLFPDRADDGDNPKFPAFYHHCTGDERRLAPLLKGIGFSQVTVLPFYGTSYFAKLPGLNRLDEGFTRLCAAQDWRLFTSFAYALAVK